MFRMVARLMRRAFAMPRRSPFTKVMCAPLDGDIGACAHSDTDLSLRQRRSVIDAVAGHGDDPPFGLKAFDHFNFLFGQYFGFHSIDTQAARHGLSRGPAVARQHDDPNTLSMQNFD